MIFSNDCLYLEPSSFYQSTLSFLDPIPARDITTTLITELGRASTHSRFNFGNTRKNVEWVLEVMSYALTLPFENFETIKAATVIYVNWITDYASGAVLKPELIQKDWEYFFPIILSQLKNLFIPRPITFSDQHAALCSTIFVSLRGLVLNANLSNQIYDNILMFLLSVTNKVFSQPDSTNSQSLAEFLGEIFSSHFFYIWIAISIRNFPTFAIWNGFAQTASRCRHNQQFVLQWAGICLILTKRVLKVHNLISNERFANSFDCHIMDECLHDCTPELLTHLWLKILYAVGDISLLSQPIEICRHTWPDIVPNEFTLSLSKQDIQSQDNAVSEKFRQLYQNIMTTLPDSFFNMMRFISSIVQLFIPDLTPSKINFISWYTTLKENAMVGKPIKHRRYSIINKSAQEPKTTATTQIEEFTGKISLNNQDLSQFKTSKILFSSTFLSFHYKNRIEANTFINLFYEWLINSCIPSKDSQNIEQINNIIKHYSDMNISYPVDITFNYNLGDQFEIGRAFAFSTMLRILTYQLDNDKILDNYKSRFYTLLCIGLCFPHHRGSLIFSSIIMSSTNIFSSNLKCVEILVPFYLKAINTILTEDVKYGSMVDLKDLRNSALKILATIIPLSSEIIDSGNKAIHTFSGNSLTFNCIFSFIVNILINGYPLESNNDNRQLFITCMVLLLHNTVHFLTTSQDLDIERCKSIITKISLDLVNVCKNALNTVIGSKTIDLVHAIGLVEFLGCISTIPNTFVPENDVCSIIKFICSFIETLASRPPIYHQKDLHSAIVASYSCLVNWVSNQKWIVFNQQCITCLQAVIELGLTGTKSKPNAVKELKEQKPISYRVFDASEYLMLILLEILSPFNQYKTIPHSSIKEDTYKDFPISYFLIENTAILSCVDICKENQDPTTIVFIRGMTGKHIYEFQMISIKPPNSTPLNDCIRIHSDQITPQSPLCFKLNNSPTFSNSSELCEADTSIIDLNTFKSKYLNQFESISAQYYAQLKEEETFIENYRKLLQEDKESDICKITPPEFTGIYHAYRILLNNFSFLSFDVKQLNNLKFSNRFLRLCNANHELEEEIQKIDETPIRTTDFAPLFIINSFNENIDDIIFHRDAIDDELFNKFMSQLGDEVTLNTHLGYSGPLTHANHLNIPFIYFSNMINELVVLPSFSFPQNKFRLQRNKSCDVIDSSQDLDDTDKCQLVRNVSIANASNITNNVKSKEHIKNTNNGIVLIWVEDVTDNLEIPITLLIERFTQLIEIPDYRPCGAILMYPHNDGMILIRTLSFPDGKPINVSPIYDGIVLKADYLAKYVRDAIFQLNVKRRLELDIYNSPHLKRKSLIQNLGKKYQSDNTISNSFMTFFD